MRSRHTFEEWENTAVKRKLCQLVVSGTFADGAWLIFSLGVLGGVFGSLLILLATMGQSIAVGPAAALQLFGRRNLNGLL